MNLKKSAFTLAEVLITLGIIGVVAALTMPSLIQDKQEKETVVRLKKFYSTISQSYILAKEEYGTPDYWYDDTEIPNSQEASNKMGDILTKNMKITKVCNEGKGCFPDIIYKKIDGKNTINWDNNDYNIAKYLTNDGYSIFFFSYGNQSANYGSGMLNKSYGAISVDINGFKGPNTWGKDTFTFILTEQGIIPSGTQTKIYNSFPSSCNRKDCNENCEGCAAWVIYNENMDYLHCDDLSWEKTKCK